MSSATEEDPEEEEPPVVEHHDLMASIAGISGNMLEWYDFSVFGFFSDIIAEVFFPPDQKGQAALIETFAVFGGAFLARPIGGAVIGYLGDNHGRKRAVETSIFLMAFPTFALGCLPSFAAVGWLSPVLLIIMRLLQGFSVGGQLMSSVVFTLERTDEKHWGVWGASVFAVTTLGVSLGSLISYILRETLDDDQLHSWGWRLPFLLGAFGVVPGAYLKFRAREHPHLPEPSHGGGAPKLERKNTFAEAFGPSNRRALLASALVPCLPAATYYIVFVWMAIYMESIVDPPVPHAFGINTAVGVLGIFLVFLGGWISDCYGKYVTLMVASSLCIAVAGPLFLHWIGQGDPVVAFSCQATMALFLSIWNGAMTPWMIKSFPPHIRSTSVNIGYNLAVSICGGFSPLVATILVDRFTNASPGYIMTVLAVVSWLGLCIAPKQTEHQPSEKSYGTVPQLRINDVEIT
jgi:MHS family proline/betaine transporter-like MFS transporter